MKRIIYLLLALFFVFIGFDTLAVVFAFLLYLTLGEATDLEDEELPSPERSEDAPVESA